jgi:hypothetical protein
MNLILATLDMVIAELACRHMARASLSLTTYRVGTHTTASECRIGELETVNIPIPGCLFLGKLVQCPSDGDRRRCWRLQPAALPLQIGCADRPAQRCLHCQHQLGVDTGRWKTGRTVIPTYPIPHFSRIWIMGPRHRVHAPPVHHPRSLSTGMICGSRPMRQDTFL